MQWNGTGRAIGVMAMSGEKIKVLVVDDHPLMCIGVAAIINAQPDMVAVDQATSGEGAIAKFEGCLPDITLMDLRLPGMGGVGVIRKIRERHKDARFIVLTTYEGDEDIYQALAAGAQGYLIKGMPHEALIDALRGVHRGRSFLPPPVRRALAARTPNSDLSQREHQVLRLLALGKTNKQIAAELRITEATVKCHVSVILGQLEAADRTQAVVIALRRGLVHL